MIRVFGTPLRRIGWEDGERRNAELDDDFGHFRGQPLAGAQVERHAGPAPGADLGFQRHEALGVGHLIRAEVGRVAGDRLAVDRALGVLAAHRQGWDLVRLHRLQGAQHLQLLVAHAIGIERHRRVHRDQAQQLQHVILQHVAQRAGFVVIAAAAFQADRLGDSDLHVVDHVGGPQAFEDRVGEAQRHQVLHRLLAEVVVDTEGLRLGKDLSDLVDDGVGGWGVVADRLFQYDAGLVGDHAVGAERLADGTVEVGRGGEVEDPDAGVVQNGVEAGPVGVVRRGVDRDIVQLRQELVDRISILIGFREVLRQGLRGALAEVVVG